MCKFQVHLCSKLVLMDVYTNLPAIQSYWNSILFPKTKGRQFSLFDEVIQIMVVNINPLESNAFIAEPGKQIDFKNETFIDRGL